MTASHTLGPWTAGTHVYQFEHDRRGVYVGQGSNTLAFCWRPEGQTDDETTLANARLIAAAPDLLAALSGTVSMIEDMLLGGLTREGLQQLCAGQLEPARAAISKATKS